MSEILRPTPHALVARFIYQDSTQKRATQADQYPLTPGSGIVFIGAKDTTSEAYSFEQTELAYMLRHITPGTLQLLTLLDQNSGSLLFTQGTQDTSYGIGKQMPKGSRYMGITYGRIQFAGIWGETEKEVRETLQELQE